MTGPSPDTLHPMQGYATREVRQRFDAEAVTRLVDIAWWPWPEDKPVRNLDANHSRDLAEPEAA